MDREEITLVVIIGAVIVSFLAFMAINARTGWMTIDSCENNWEYSEHASWIPPTNYVGVQNDNGWFVEGEGSIHLYSKLDTGDGHMQFSKGFDFSAYDNIEITVKSNGNSDMWPEHPIHAQILIGDNIAWEKPTSYEFIENVNIDVSGIDNARITLREKNVGHEGLAKTGDVWFDDLRGYKSLW